MSRVVRGPVGPGWLARAPRTLPSLELMLDDIGASDRAVAAHLGVTPRTVERWRFDGVASRAASLALFYETRWGRSVVGAEVENRARLLAEAYRVERSLRLEAERALRAAAAVGDFGSANAPTVHEAAQLVDVADALAIGVQELVAERGQELDGRSLPGAEAPPVVRRRAGS